MSNVTNIPSSPTTYTTWVIGLALSSMVLGAISVGTLLGAIYGNVSLDAKVALTMTSGLTVILSAGSGVLSYKIYRISKAEEKKHS